jgi:gamma-glutamyltranspeptidase/glutathione hydrolase
MSNTRRDFLRHAGATAIGVWAGSATAKADATTGLVTGQPEAGKVGNEVLAAGGNAVDAAVAAALVAGVVAVPSCGIGGYGGHMVIATGDGKVTAIDFNSTAPAAARDDMFPVGENGAVKDEINAYGWLAAGVPGTLAGMQLAADKYGTMLISELLKPAISYAREGFVVSKRLAAAIKVAAPRFAKDLASARLFLKDGQPLAEGATFRNPDLARMLQRLADDNTVEAFYRGELARKIAAAFKANGGIVTADDLAAHRAREVTPLALEWRGHTMHTAPLTAGGLTVLQALGALKAVGWQKWDAADEKTTHARVEALRIAWHDRLSLLGDPEKVAVPVKRLLSEDYAAKSAERIRAAVKEGKPVPAGTDGRAADGTIHLTAADRRGTLVALTLTHGESFGAQVTVDGLGLVLGHGMSRFDPRPKRANSVGPGKRPLHNMCPTAVLRDGKPVVVLGATGGRRIPNTLFDVLLNLVGRGLPLDEAVKAPRQHTEGGDKLVLEAAWPAAHVAYLKSIGYTVTTGGGAALNAIARDPATGKLEAAAR